MVCPETERSLIKLLAPPLGKFFFTMPVSTPVALFYALEKVMRIIAVRKFCAELF